MLSFLLLFSLCELQVIDYVGCQVPFLIVVSVTEKKLLSFSVLFYPFIDDILWFRKHVDYCECP